MNNFNKQVLELYDKGWITDKIAIKFAVQISTIQVIIYKHKKDF